MDQQPDNLPATHVISHIIELAAKQDSTDSERSRALDMAHSALADARESQNSVREQQALTFVSFLLLKMGQAQAAVDFAEHALALCQKNADRQTTFDRSCTLAAAAKAFNAAGKSNEAFGHILQALDEADKLVDEERTTFDRLFGEG